MYPLMNFSPLVGAKGFAFLPLTHKQHVLDTSELWGVCGVPPFNTSIVVIQTNTLYPIKRRMRKVLLFEESNILWGTENLVMLLVLNHIGTKLKGSLLAFDP